MGGNACAYSISSVLFIAVVIFEIGSYYIALWLSSRSIYFPNTVVKARIATISSTLL